MIQSKIFAFYCLQTILAAFLSGTDGINESDHPLSTGIKNPIQPVFRDGSDDDDSNGIDSELRSIKTLQSNADDSDERKTIEVDFGDGLGFEEMIEDEYQRPTRNVGVLKFSNDVDDAFDTKLFQKRPVGLLRMGRSEGNFEDEINENDFDDDTKRHVSMLRMGKRAVQLLRMGKRPVELLRMGKRPVDLLRMGKRPVDLLRMGKRPVDLLRMGKRPVDLLRMGKRPVDLLRMGK